MSAKPSFLEPQFQGEYGHSPWPTQKCPSVEQLRLLANQRQSPANASAAQQNTPLPQTTMKLDIDSVAFAQKGGSIKGVQIALTGPNQQFHVTNMETSITATANGQQGTLTEICGVNLLGDADGLHKVISAFK